jgi:hypothetical protein
MKGRDGTGGGKAKKEEMEWRARRRQRAKAGELKSKIGSEGMRDRARGQRKASGGN